MVKGMGRREGEMDGIEKGTGERERQRWMGGRKGWEGGMGSRPL